MSFSIFVHCIEARHLAPKDGSPDGGTSDPVVVLSVNGVTREQRTRPKQKDLNPIWDEWVVVPSVPIRAEPPHDFGQLLVRVVDVDTFGADDEIGAFELDLRHVWERPNHCLQRTWVPLTYGGESDDSDDEEDDPEGGSGALQGVLKLTVQIRLAGDAQPELSPASGSDDTEDLDSEFEQLEPHFQLDDYVLEASCAEFEVGEGFDGPFDIRANYANTQRRRALGMLPQRDGASGMRRAAVEGVSFKVPYTLVRGAAQDLFEGHGTAVTPSAGGGAQGARALTFAQRRGAHSDRLSIGVWDREKLGKDRPVGVGTVRLSEIQAGHWGGGWAWLNLYGSAPQQQGGVGSWVARLLSKTTGVGSAAQAEALSEQMNEGARPGSAFAGRVLLKLSCRRVLRNEGLLLERLPACCTSVGGSSGGGSSGGGSGGNSAGLSGWAAAIAPPAESVLCMSPAASAARAAAVAEGAAAVSGYRIRGLALQACCLPAERGAYVLEVSCGAVAVHTQPLGAEGASVNWWAAAANGMELPPLEFTDFKPLPGAGEQEEEDDDDGYGGGQAVGSHSSSSSSLQRKRVKPDLSQLPDVFVSLYHGKGAQKFAKAQAALAQCHAKQAERRRAALAASERSTSSGASGGGGGSSSPRAAQLERAVREAESAVREARLGRLSYCRLEPTSLAPELSLAHAGWYTLQVDPFGAAGEHLLNHLVPATGALGSVDDELAFAAAEEAAAASATGDSGGSGTGGGSVMLSFSVEPLFVDTARRRRHPTTGNRRSITSRSSNSSAHDGEEGEMLRREAYDRRNLSPTSKSPKKRRHSAAGSPTPGNSSASAHSPEALPPLSDASPFGRGRQDQTTGFGKEARRRQAVRRLAEVERTAGRLRTELRGLERRRTRMALTVVEARGVHDPSAVRGGGKAVGRRLLKPGAPYFVAVSVVPAVAAPAHRSPPRGSPRPEEIAVDLTPITRKTRETTAASEGQGQGGGGGADARGGSLLWRQTLALDLPGDAAGGEFRCEVCARDGSSYASVSTTTPTSSSADSSRRRGGRSSGMRRLCSTPSIQLRRLVAAGHSRAWFPLMEGGVRTGQLALEIVLTPPPDTAQTQAMTAELQQQLHTLAEESASLEAKLGRRRSHHGGDSSGALGGGGGGGGGGGVRGGREELVGGSLRSQQRLLAWGGPPPVLVPYELRVHVYQALGLPPLDGNGSANPLVRVLSPHWATAVGGGRSGVGVGAAARDAMATELQRGTLAPRWYESFFLPLTLPREAALVHLWAPQLVLNLLHHQDTSLLPFGSGTERLIGRISLELLSQQQQQQQQQQQHATAADAAARDESRGGGSRRSPVMHRSSPRSSSSPSSSSSSSSSRGASSSSSSSRTVASMEPTWLSVQAGCGPASSSSAQLLVGYELIRSGGGEASSPSAVPQPLPLRQARYTVWVLAIGCRGLQGRGGKLKLAVPGLTEQRPQAQALLPPRGAGGSGGYDTSYCYDPGSARQTNSLRPGGGQNEDWQKLGFVRLDVELADAVNPAPYGYHPVLLASVLEGGASGARELGAATIELRPFMLTASDDDSSSRSSSRRSGVGSRRGRRRRASRARLPGGGTESAGQATAQRHRSLCSPKTRQPHGWFERLRGSSSTDTVASCAGREEYDGLARDSMLGDDIEDSARAWSPPSSPRTSAAGISSGDDDGGGGGDDAASSGNEEGAGSTGHEKEDAFRRRHRLSRVSLPSPPQSSSAAAAAGGGGGWPAWDWRGGRPVLSPAQVHRALYMHKETSVGRSFALRHGSSARGGWSGDETGSAGGAGASAGAALAGAAGVIKAALCVQPQQPPHAPPPAELLDLRKLYAVKPVRVKVYVYVIRAMHVAPADADGSAQCQLSLKLPGAKLKLHKSPKQAATGRKSSLNPYFGQLWESEIELPGGGAAAGASSQLEVCLEDHDMFGDTLNRNDLIGSAVLDLEARHMALQRKGSLWWETQREFRHAPIEQIPLYKPGVRHAQGTLELWVDLFPEERVRGGQLQPLYEAAVHKSNAARWRAFSRTPEMFEMRVAVLKAEGMTTMDAGDQNDLFITAEVVTGGEDGTAVTSQQERTDTHENAGRGGSFNQWLKFELPLFHPIPTMPDHLRQKQRLLLKAWDADIMGNDMIGSFDSGGSDDPARRLDVDQLLTQALGAGGSTADGDGGGKAGGKKARTRNQKRFRKRLPAPKPGKNGQPNPTGPPNPTMITFRKQIGALRRGGQGRGGIAAGAPWGALTDMLHGESGAQGQSRGRLELHLEVLPAELAKANKPADLGPPDRPSLRERLNPFKNVGGLVRMFFPGCPGAEFFQQYLCCCCVLSFMAIIVMATILKIPDIIVSKIFGV